MSSLMNRCRGSIVGTPGGSFVGNLHAKLLRQREEDLALECICTGSGEPSSGVGSVS